MKTVWAENRGVIETFNFDYPNGFGAYPKPDYSHNTQVINIAIENQLASYDIGICFWAAGEESLIENCSVSYAKKANILIGGYSAVMTVNRTSVWHCKEGYGILLTNHPKLDFATGISSADGGRSSEAQFV
jgi:hypothetical protein